MPRDREDEEGVRIINCARGGLVDEAALAEALEERAGGRRGVRRVCRRSRRPKIRCSAIPTSSARRISARRRGEAQENVALQIAEQMSDYLLRGAISNAVNFPVDHRGRSAEAQAVHCARREARLFAGQLTETGISKVQIAYEGAVAQMNTKALTSAALAGLLRPMLGDINVVSAPVVAKERGIVVEESDARKATATMRASSP